MTNSNLDIPDTISGEMIFQESILTIRRDILKRQNSSPYPYYSLITKPYAVVILAKTSEDLYVLCEEYRHPAKKFLLCCPGGYIEETEDPLKAAQRELLEETGFSGSSANLLGAAYPYPGISEQKTLFISVKGAIKTSNTFLEKSEIIKTILVGKQEIYKRIQEGVELDASLCTALFFDDLLKIR
jgi:ADP-ribose pyrophosphatase